MSDELEIYTIYDSPDDFPGLFVARRFLVTKAGPVPTTTVVYGDSLGDIRGAMLGKGLTRIDRSPEDHPNVVESWL